MTLKCLKIDFYANKIANFLGTSAKMSYNLCRPFYILKNIRRPKSEISTYVNNNQKFLLHIALLINLYIYHLHRSNNKWMENDEQSNCLLLFIFILHHNKYFHCTISLLSLKNFNFLYLREDQEHRGPPQIQG